MGRVGEWESMECYRAHFVISSFLWPNTCNTENYSSYHINIVYQLVAVGLLNMLCSLKLNPQSQVYIHENIYPSKRDKKKIANNFIKTDQRNFYTEFKNTCYLLLRGRRHYISSLKTHFQDWSDDVLVAIRLACKLKRLLQVLIKYIVKFLYHYIYNLHVNNWVFQKS